MVIIPPHHFRCPCYQKLDWWQHEKSRLSHSSAMVKIPSPGTLVCPLLLLSYAMG